MAKLTLASEWKDIIKLATTDLALGGDPTFDGSDEATDGWANAQAQKLGNRTEWLRDQVEGTQDGTLILNGVLPARARNCALSAPSDATTGQLQAIKRQSATAWRIPGATSTVVLAFAAGVDTLGRAKDYLYPVTSNVDVNNVFPAKTLSYSWAYAERNAGTGVVTYSETDVQPLFYPIAPTSPATNQLWYNPNTGITQRWGGASWATVQICFLGEILYSVTAGQTAAANDVQSYQVARERGANDGCPVGSVMLITSNVTKPDGWLRCDGAAISRTAFYPLFFACGTVYGAGDGSTTFNLPDLTASEPANFDYIIKV